MVAVGDSAVAEGRVVAVEVGIVVEVGGKGVVVGVLLGISVWLAVGVSVPKLMMMITLGVVVGTFGTQRKLPGVMNVVKRQFAL